MGRWRMEVGRWRDQHPMKHQPQRFPELQNPSRPFSQSPLRAQNFAASTSEISRTAKPNSVLLSITVTSSGFLRTVKHFGVSRGSQAQGSHSSFLCVLCEEGTNSVKPSVSSCFHCISGFE